MTTAALTSFRSYLYHAGYGKTTCMMLPVCVGDFLKYCRTSFFEQIAPEHVMDFYRWLHVRPNRRRVGALSESYIYQHIYALRVFFGWLEECGSLAVNPMNAVLIKPPKKSERQPLSRDEIKSLFDACMSFKELCLLHLFYSCGLRREEAVRLDLRDMNFKKGLLFVRCGKGGKRRAVPMTERVSGDMENYIRYERDPFGNGGAEAFMLNKRGMRMSGDCYIRLLKALLLRAQMEHSGYTLHHLRHSIATHLLENGLDLEEVREFLGHRHIESTQVYVKVNEQQLKTMIND